ncbi:MAG TPA: sodium:solute symporter [Pirellulales bacterium]
MDHLPAVDLAVLLVYLGATVGLGCWFGLRKRNTEEFMAGGRALPVWAVGLSMFGSYISSISFLGNPGKSFATNWNYFAFGLATPLAALIAVKWFVPFYRRTGEVSAYEHLERRFGLWARTYAVVCFLLTQMARNGTIVYLLALAVSPLTGWSVPMVIAMTGALMVLYTIFGGMEAAVWIGVVQSVVLILGPIVCLVALLSQVPGGLPKIVSLAADNHKFSLGRSPDTTQPTFWVVLIYGMVINLGNFGIDQSYVQRYVTTRDEKGAKQSVWIASLLYVPVSAIFFFIGTALWALYMARPEFISGSIDVSKRPDDVFPFFIAHNLPIGMSGLVVAAIFAASMDSSLSSMATLSLCDIYKRYFRPEASEKESMFVLHVSTILWGVLCTAAALAMIQVRNVLDVWWNFAGIFSGGMLGLFLLGLISRRANNAIAAVAVVVGVLVILWMSISPTKAWPESWSAFRSPFHDYLTTVFGTLAILIVGLVLSIFRRGKQA